MVSTTETSATQKARGGFYTSEALAEFLATWAVTSDNDRTLEPSAGDGVFLVALRRRYEQLGATNLNGRVLAVERDPVEAGAAAGLATGADVRALDFFDLDPTEVGPVDAVVGNPPYIRFHAFTGTDRRKGLARARAQGVALTQLASSWAHFVVHACAFLARTGRLALVLPAELLHADYASPVRSYLLREFASVTVVAFDRPVFPAAQVDAVLLLAARGGEEGFRVVRVASADALEAADLRWEARTLERPQRWSASVDHGAAAVYDEAIKSGVGSRLGSFASVDIGFVTGANDYFILKKEDAERLGLPPSSLSSVIRRPSDVPGIIPLPSEEHVLLALSRDLSPDPSVARYLRVGEQLGIPHRYKCRSRTPWYAVPLPKRRSDAFIPYMSNLGPRLMVNEHKARSSNLLHSVELAEGAPRVDVLAVSAATSLTLLSAEIEGRAYGGGVLKLETKEAERLLIPVCDDADQKHTSGAMHVVDALLREGRHRDAVRVADDALGLDHDRYWAAYIAFRSRRLKRRRASANGDPDQ